MSTIRPDDDPRVEPAERELYLLLGYLTVAFVVASFVTSTFMPESIASGVAVSLVTFGSWFAGPVKRSRIAVSRWLLFSIAAGGLAAAARYGIGIFF